jgi:lysophospholipase L1-like esterase
MNYKIVIPALLLTAVTIGASSFLAGYRFYPRRHPFAQGHFYLRELAILSQAAEIDHPVALMLGDSITEFAYLPSICRGTILNAGVAGATLANTFDLSQRILKLIRPSKIIIAIGTNDAQTAIETSPDIFASRYGSLVEKARATGAELYVANIPPIALEGQRVVDPTRILKLNQIIENVSKATDAPLIDLFGGMQPVNGFLPSALTTDGIHLTPAGYNRWLRTLSSVCP